MSPLPTAGTVAGSLRRLPAAPPQEEVPWSCLRRVIGDALRARRQGQHARCVRCRPPPTSAWDISPRSNVARRKRPASCSPRSARRSEHACPKFWRSERHACARRGCGRRARPARAGPDRDHRGQPRPVEGCRGQERPGQRPRPRLCARSPPTGTSLSPSARSLRSRRPCTRPASVVATWFTPPDRPLPARSRIRRRRNAYRRVASMSGEPTKRP